MNALAGLLNWFAGDGRYMLLRDCMGGDHFWIAATITLDLANAAGYVLIVIHWWRNARTLPRLPAKSALGNIRNIFIFCGICGYLFIPIKMYWPAWRLYDIVLAVLVFYTWRYALSARELKVVYSAIGQTNRLQEDLQLSIAESKRKSLFLNAISHDLRTPLNGLMLQANLAEMNLQDPQQLRESLREIRASAAATASLLDSLLDFARVDWSENVNANEQILLRELIDQCFASHHAMASSRNLELQTRCPDDLTILSDRVKLERIIQNLVANAIKFTPSGTIRIEADDSLTGTEIHVIDTGVGITKENQGHLFNEFYQINNHERDRNKGFGLGLAISRRLARQLGGDLVVESELGRGARFTILLPRGEQQSDARARRDETGRVAVVGV